MGAGVLQEVGLQCPLQALGTTPMHQVDQGRKWSRRPPGAAMAVGRRRQR